MQAADMQAATDPPTRIDIWHAAPRRARNAAAARGAALSTHHDLRVGPQSILEVFERWPLWLGTPAHESSKAWRGSSERAFLFRRRRKQLAEASSSTATWASATVTNPGTSGGRCSLCSSLRSAKPTPGRRRRRLPWWISATVAVAVACANRTRVWLTPHTVTDTPGALQESNPQRAQAQGAD